MVGIPRANKFVAKTMARSSADWESVEREYRAGQLSVREIGRLHGVSHTAIAKCARKEGWTRDLAARVREEVATRLVSSEVAAEQAVDDAATRVIALVREHRQDIRSARQLVATLVAELQDASDNISEIEDAIEAEPDSNRRRMMQKAVTLPARASVIASLSTALKNLVGLERQAFNMDSDTPTIKTAFTLPPEEFEAIARELIDCV
jgi:hypothetical protein